MSARPESLLHCTFSARTDALVERLRDDGVPWEQIAEALRKDDGESS